MILHELAMTQMPEIFERFCNAIGESSWRKPVRLRREHCRKSPELLGYYEQEMDVAFQLDRCSEMSKKYGRLIPGELERLHLHKACMFASQALSMLDALTSKHREAIKGRIQGALKKPDDMRGMLLEFAMATHFIRRGSQVIWPEFEPASSSIFGATYDLYVPDLGLLGLEVECKSVSNDKGRRFHQEEIVKFQSVLRSELEQMSKTLEVGLAVMLTVPDRLPSDAADIKRLASVVRKQVIVGQSCTKEDGTRISINEFDIELIRNVPAVPNSPAMRAVVETVTSTKNRNAMILRKRNGGAIVVAVQSARDDSLLTAVFATAEDAARRQLSKTKPGLIVLGFDGIEAEDLRGIAAEESTNPSNPTALRIAVSNFLNSISRSHIAAVGFVSKGAINPRADGGIDTGGTIYNFRILTVPTGIKTSLRYSLSCVSTCGR